MTYKVYIETDGPVEQYGKALIRLGLRHGVPLEPGAGDWLVIGNNTHYLIRSIRDKEGQETGKNLVASLNEIDFIVNATLQDDEKLN